MRRCKPRPEAQERPACQPAKAEAPIVFVDDDDEAMRERSQACFDRSVSRSRQTERPRPAEPIKASAIRSRNQYGSSFRYTQGAKMIPLISDQMRASPAPW